MEVPFAEALPAQLDEMLVMRKKKDLSAFRKLRELRQDGSGPGVIESDEQVVENERHRLVIFKMTIQRGDAEREIELIACALAQRGHEQNRHAPASPVLDQHAR